MRRALVIVALAAPCPVVGAGPLATIDYFPTAIATVQRGGTEHGPRPPANGPYETKAAIKGLEARTCSPNPAEQSSANASSWGVTTKNSDGIVDLALGALISAKGGKYSTCNKCDTQQLCSDPGPDVATHGEAKAAVTASVIYKFPDDLRGASTYRFRFRVMNRQGTFAGDTLKLWIERSNAPGQVTLLPGSTTYLDLAAGEDVTVTAMLEARTRITKSDETFTDTINARLRFEMVDAPILEASAVQGYILNGKPTSAFTSVGLITLADENGIMQPHCTGSVIGSRSILTAAHCVVKDRLRNAIAANRLLFLPTHSLQAGGVTPIAVTGFKFPRGEEPEKFEFNELPTKALEDDIAILYTNAPLGLEVLGLYSGPPPLDDIVTRRKDVTFVGFGLNPTPDATTAAERRMGEKREATGPILQPDNRSFGVSTQHTGGSTCRGDSGGPALIKVGNDYKILGVTSYGAMNCSSGRSMRADFYSSWIRRHIQ